ncbi:MAG: hypothetical protein RR326_08190 [Stenotrophomonas sp.]
MSFLTTAKQRQDSSVPRHMRRQASSPRHPGTGFRTRDLLSPSADFRTQTSLPTTTNPQSAMPKNPRLDNEANLLIDRITRRLAEARPLDPATSALLEDVAAHLQQAVLADPAQRPYSPLHVRTMRELQPVLTALREQCITEAATAALGAAAGRWLSSSESEAGASRLDVSKESRAQLLRMRAALSNTKGIHRRCHSR